MIDDIILCSRCNALFPKSKMTMRLYVNAIDLENDRVHVSEIVLCRRCAKITPK